MATSNQEGLESAMKLQAFKFSGFILKSKSSGYNEGVKFFDGMMFKVLVVAIPSLCIVLLTAWILWSEQSKRSRHANEQERLRVAMRQWEDEHRSVMVRIYRNLSLEHYLAAYRNIEALSPPPEFRSTLYREFYEALNRIAHGLLEDEFFDEAEEAFRDLQFVREYEEGARAATSRIASRRRLDSARGFLSRGIELVEEERYRDGKNELEKAQLQLDSVRLFGLDDTEAEDRKLAAALHEARYQVFMMDARHHIDQARRLFVNRVFDAVVQEMQFASGNVGRAAFFKPESDEVGALRDELQELKAQLAYEVPNSMPIFNLYRPEVMDSAAPFFVLDGYHFDLLDEEEDQIQIGLRYRMRVNEGDFNIVRYQAFLFDGRHFFNGHYLRPEEGDSSEEVQALNFIQEVPVAYRNSPVKRLDLRIYDRQNRLLSHVTRSFLPPEAN